MSTKLFTAAEFDAARKKKLPKITQTRTVTLPDGKRCNVKTLSQGWEIDSDFFYLHMSDGYSHRFTSAELLKLADGPTARNAPRHFQNLLTS